SKKGHLGSFRAHHPFIDTGITSISDDKPVSAENVEIAGSCDDGVRHFRNFISWIALDVAEVGNDRVDLGWIKTSDPQIKSNLGEDNLEVFEFKRERFAVPSRVFCKFIVGKRVSANFGVIQVRYSDDRNLVQSEKLARFCASMTCYDVSAVIHYQRVDHT